jgi:exodeoxyribonuclease VII small subunit
MTFEQAIQQLEALTAKLEKGDVDLAQLNAEIKQAQSLIAFCKEQLGQVKKDVEQLEMPAQL